LLGDVIDDGGAVSEFAVSSGTSLLLRLRAIVVVLTVNYH
jgi:hypothetical protein